MPDIKQAYVSRSPHNHYWFPSTGVTYLCPNDSLAKYSSADVRKGISAAINHPFARKIILGSLKLTGKPRQQRLT